LATTAERLRAFLRRAGSKDDLWQSSGCVARELCPVNVSTTEDFKMLTLSEAAGSLLGQLLDKAEAPEDSAVRFVSGSSGLNMKVDKPHPGDAKFTHEGKTVLVLDERISELLAERTLVVKDSDTGAKLAFT